VAANLGGIPEAVGPSGRLFPVDDEDAFASLVKDLLSDHDETAELGARAAEHAESYSWRAIVDAAEAIYGRVLND
jgi:D-inositol-3-phosphate glycosyltransferase